MRYRAGGDPISKAARRQALRHEILAKKTQLYLMKPNEDCKELMLALAQIFTWMAHACELDNKVGTDNAHYRILQGSISAAHQLYQTSRWDPLQAQALEIGLDAAFELNNRLNPKKLVKALNNLLSS